MGFFDSLLEGLVESGIKGTEDKYRQMGLSELEREWESVYAHMSFPSDPNCDLDTIVDSKSPNGVLDRIYEERTQKSSWRRKALQHQQREKQKEIEQQQRILHQKSEQEQDRKEKDQREKEAAAFMAQLAKSEMARIILDKIDALGDKAIYVAVFPDRVIVNDNDYFLETFIYEDGYGLEELDSYNYLCEMKYKKYKYPNLTPAQVLGLRKYITETAKNKYKLIPRGRYQHKDYPGCLRLVEDESDIRASW